MVLELKILGYELEKRSEWKCRFSADARPKAVNPKTATGWQNIRCTSTTGIPNHLAFQIASKVTHKMPKERSINPAQAQRKAEKAKAIKKGKLLLCRVPRLLRI